MHRFFIPPEIWQADTIRLGDDQARQIANVLRMRPGQQMVVMDGQAREALIELMDVSSALVTGRVIARSKSSAEPRARVNLYQGMTQREKFEWILQKGTELGMAACVPLLTERSLVQETRFDPSRRQRWERILLEAAEQSGRGTIPSLSDPIRLAPALASLQSQNIITLFAWEEESWTGHPVRAQLQMIRADQQSPVAIFIGPEGGFSRAEAELARQSGAEMMTLGPRVLRTETAAVVALTLVMEALGEL